MAYGDLPMGAPHKPNKGLEGGACNRERCQAEPANWYNHGSYKWYCRSCAIDIGQDSVNLRDWNLRWRPDCGHDQFETREMMDARKFATETEYVYDCFTWAGQRVMHLDASSDEEALQKAENLRDHGSGKVIKRTKTVLAELPVGENHVGRCF